MVNEIQHQHGILIDLIEKLEQHPTTNPKTIFQLTQLQQHVLDTLNRLIAESVAEIEPLPQSQLLERVQKKHMHSQILVKLKLEIDQQLDNLSF
ncbi:hypothetical protein GCM10028804_20070 [Larkinella terrae]